MNPNGQKAGTLRFGTFELDVEGRELRKSGAPVKLQSQQIQLLTLLAERAGEVVSREEIRRVLWDDNTFVDFDQSINFCVNKVRDALGDDPQSPRYIETVPRKGYRFIAPVTAPSPSAEPEPPPAAAQPPLAANAAPKLAPNRRWWLFGIAAVAIAAIALVALTFVSRHQATKPIESLAVLPLDNLSRDPSQDYFADGMTDDLITDLAKISALRVISRTSIMQYKGTKKSVPQIARELNVDAVLEGTVTRDKDRVRITAQLIRAEPEKHLWAEKYEANLSEILTVQDNVAKTVAHEIQVKVTPAEQARLSSPRAVDPEAYDSYLRGRYLYEHPTEENLRKSRDYLERSIAKDPGYALAWAGLADTFNMSANYGLVPSREGRPRARAAAEKALQLDGSLAGPLVSLANVKRNLEWDWDGSERLFKQAIEFNPNDGGAHHGYAILLAELGRTQEAVAEERRARDADPLSPVFGANVVWKLYLAHQYDEADWEIRKLVQADPKEAGGYINASVHLRLGRRQEALAELREGVVASHGAILELMFLAHALGVTGAKAEGRKVLEEMQTPPSRYVPPEYIALVYEGLGEREKALEWFEKAVAERSMNGWLLPDPRLDSIRTEPRFKSLMRRMGLPE
jgi:TolB-like protein/DNA-binding winged helix-turn-helix (wHTH) protein/Tfp pilus assembly protein PilF